MDKYNSPPLSSENIWWLRLGFYASWVAYLFMDCSTARLQMKLEWIFVLYPEKCKEIGKIGEILSGGPRTEKNLGKMTLKRSSKIQKKFFGGPRTETKFVKWSTSRKRLRTAVLEEACYWRCYYKSSYLQLQLHSNITILQWNNKVTEIGAIKIN